MADPTVVLDAHDRYGLPLAWSADGETLFTGGFDGVVGAWSVPDMAERARATVHDRSVNCGAPAGDRLYTGSTDRTIRGSDSDLADTDTVMAGHTDTVADVATHPDDRLLASASYDTTVRIWSFPDAVEQRVISGHPKNVTCVAFLPDGDRVLSGGLGDEAHVWDVAGGESVATLAGHGSAVADVAAPPTDHAWTVSYDGVVSGWSTTDWSATTRVDLDVDGKATGLAARPGAAELAVTVDGGVRLLTPDGDVVGSHETPITGISSPCWSPDGEWLALGGADGVVRLYGDAAF